MTCMWNKDRNYGINVSLGGMKGGIKRGIMWNKNEGVELCGIKTWNKIMNAWNYVE